MDSAEIVNDIFILIAGTSSLLIMAVALLAFIWLFQKKIIKKEKAFREIEKLLKDQEIRSTYAVIDGQEKERKRIAEDLHDNMGSILAVAKLFAYNVIEAGDPQTQAGAAEKVLQIIERAVDENRRIAYDLDAVSLKHFGLTRAVAQLCEALNDSHRMEVRSFIDIKIAIENDLSFNVYRIIQELFNNALKHSDASWVSIHMETINNHYLSLIFEDNGRGFTQRERKEGMGLKNIRARVIKFNGRIDIDGNPGKGTTIVVEIPLK